MLPANNIMIYLSLLVALLCQLFPWTGQGIIFRPDFMLVVLLYWLLRAPNMCNIGAAWAVGLLVDLATSGLLGQYALAFTLTAYIGLSYQRRIVLFNQSQLVVYVFGLLLFERIVILVIKLLAGHENPGLHFFWPVLTSLLLWRVMTFIFGRITRPKAT